MSSTDQYLEFVLDLLGELEDVAHRKMMGEYVLYYRSKVVGGIYDDRFLLKVDVPYPKGNEELEILRRMSVKAPTATRILDPELTRSLQDRASNIFVHNLVAEYIVRLILATRNPADFNMPDLARVISIGCSSRATLGLVAAARAVALIHGRDYVLPIDVQAIAPDVMAHRIMLSFDAIADDVSAAQVVERILAMVPAPTPVWNNRAPAAPRQPVAPEVR